MTYTPGIDVSRYEGDIDWAKVYAAGYRFAIMRATVGDYYTDPTFETNWTNAKKAGMLLSAYHVLVATKDAGNQISRFFSVLNGRKSDFPWILDIERKDVSSKATNTSSIQNCISEVLKRDSRKPIIYTAKYFWQDYVTSLSSWSQYDLWVACYSSKAYLPSDWSSWKFWQYSDSGKVNGVSGGTDLNWFNGSYDDLKRYCGGSTSTDTSSSVSTNLKAKVLVSVLNVRSGPGTSYSILSRLTQGTTVSILDIAGTDTWLQIGANKWAAAIYGGQQYLQMVPGSPFKARCTVDKLNVRLGPGTGYAITSSLKNGDEVSVSGISGRNAWVKFESGKWCAFTQGSDKYLQLV